MLTGNARDFSPRKSCDSQEARETEPDDKIDGVRLLQCLPNPWVQTGGEEREII